MMRPSLITPPATLALSWENDIKTHLRVTTDEERARVEALLIPAVTEWIEALTNRQLIAATWGFWYSSFAAAANQWGAIVIPRAPLLAIAAINYYDQSNTLQTWGDENYVVHTPTGPRASAGWIWPVSGRTWFPTTYSRPDAVEIQAVCGYGQIPEQVPGGLRQAMLLLLSELFERREHASIDSVDEVPLGAVRIGLSYLVEV